MKEITKPKLINKVPEPIVLEIAHFGNLYILPQKGKPRSIGYDLTVPEDVKIPAHSRFKIPLNIAINLPEGIEAKIEPRNGFELYGMEGFGTRKVWRFLFGIIPFFRKNITGVQRWDCDVLVGKIDPGYTDNINVIVKNNDREFTVKRGTRIAQMTFYRVLSPRFNIVDTLSCDSRGGGLGSSGTGQLLPENDDLCPEERICRFTNGMPSFLWKNVQKSTTVHSDKYSIHKSSTMVVILTATKEEFRLALENLEGYSIIRMGVGASNVIRTISCLPFPKDKCRFINVGFCGSNTLPVGTVTKVSKTYRLKDKSVEFEDPLDGFFLGIDGYDCYTSNSFVTESTSVAPVLYDMELSYIAAFPIELLGSVKIVSDNLDVSQYEKTIDTTSAEVWAEVKKIVDEIASVIK